MIELVTLPVSSQSWATGSRWTSCRDVPSPSTFRLGREQGSLWGIQSVSRLRNSSAESKWKLQIFFREAHLSKAMNDFKHIGTFAVLFHTLTSSYFIFLNRNERDWSNDLTWKLTKYTVQNDLTLSHLNYKYCDLQICDHPIVNSLFRIKNVIHFIQLFWNITSNKFLSCFGLILWNLNITNIFQFPSSLLTSYFYNHVQNVIYCLYKQS